MARGQTGTAERNEAQDWRSSPASVAITTRTRPASLLQQGAQGAEVGSLRFHYLQRTSRSASMLATASAQGAAQTLDQAVAYARRSRGERRRPPRGWASLTPAEARVADLAARGLSNAEIAAELFVTPNTTKTHLSRVFAKLGVSNRTALAPPRR